MNEYGHSEEYKQLEQAIAALELQRTGLGDAVVDPAIVALRNQQAGLGEEHLPQTRKQVTVLFADVSGFTAMSESMDPEEVSDMMNALWKHLDVCILEHGGMIDKHLGDGVMALWGAKTSQEDDPKRAIQAALAMQTAVSQISVPNTDLGLRIGVHTGPVLLGEVGTKGEFSALGDTVNLASRLEGAAPTGRVLISHDTYRHVRGIFDVFPQEPLQVKGKSEPLHTYLVQRAKPHIFRMQTRGVEGVMTRMVGREAELLTLQNLFNDIIEDGEPRLVTVVGEAGVGKSRLLYELEKWIELLPYEIHRFESWATPSMQVTSYAPFRRMFAQRFNIMESDSAPAVMEKFRNGMAVALEPDQADLTGHLIGFDFSSSQAVQDALNGVVFKEQAVTGLTEYFRAVTHKPTVVFLEDIHWADDSSLDLINHLAEALPEARLLLVCLARPLLFERRPSWGEGKNIYLRLNLKTLSRRESRVLVAEILQKVEDVPAELRDLVVDGAEGNPFYVEELIKMLMDDGVIQGGNGIWQVAMKRLAEVHVPSTLVGVLQARLDSLPTGEKALLQRASVVGRLFWDMAVAELAADDEEKIFDKNELAPLLETVCTRGLVFRREHSAFAGTEEFTFKHALLRDVTYDTVLLKLRRMYHQQVASWLEAKSGDRLGEYLGLIGLHYELAGDKVRAADYLLRSGDRARLASAHQEAIEYYQRALVFLKEQGNHERAARTLMKLGLVFHMAYDYQRSRNAYEEGFAMLEQAEKDQPNIPLQPAPQALRILTSLPSTLDLIMINDLYATVLIKQLFSGLVEEGVGMEVMPDIARSWEISEGGRQYIFHLREDVFWTDGVPVTAGDFEYTWKRILDPASGSPNAGLLYDIKGAGAFHQGEESDSGSIGVQAPDDRTLLIELERPTGYFLSLLAQSSCFPVPKHVLEIYGENWAQPDTIVTNGAFRLESWNQGESMVLVRNPEYHGRFKGNLQRVEPSFETNDVALLDLYETGNLDILDLDALPASAWDRTRRRFAGEYVTAPKAVTEYIGFDVSRPPFDDPRVRQAFAMVADKTTLANAVLGGYNFPAMGGYIPPGVPGYSKDISLPFDPENARQLLAGAGYPNGNGFPGVTACIAENRRSLAEYLQTQWRDNLGVEIPWEYTPWPQFYERLEREPVHIIYIGWMADYLDPDSFLRENYLLQRYVHWQDETYDKLVEKARGVLEQEQRLGLYTQADRILNEAAAIIPVLYPRSNILVRPWVRKFPALFLQGWLWKNIVVGVH